MPLRQLDIARFDGMYGGADARDLPPGIAAFSFNADPLAAAGELKGIGSPEIVLAGGGGRAYALSEDGTSAVFASGSGTSSVLKRITGLGLTPAVTTIFTPTSAETDGSVCTVSDGRAVHVGMGKKSLSKPRWVGEVGYGHFGGSAPAGVQVEDATLTPPGTGAPAAISVTTFAGGGTGAVFETGHNYFLAFSFVYDEAQESPLSQDSTTWATGVLAGDAQYLDIGLSVTTAKVPARVSAINVYRAESVGGAAPTSDWTFVRSIGINEAGWGTADGGVTHTYAFHDNGAVGQTYEDRTGISSTLDSFQIHYGVSCATEGYHFISNCYHPSIADADHYLFRSKAYRFDMFDWAGEYLRLPFVPVALVPYAGLIFAFSEGRLAVIHPASLAIVDMFEGIGTFSPESVVVTGRGLFFVSRRNLYFVEPGSRTPVAVGEPILKLDYTYTTGGGSSLDVGWLDITHESSPVCLYDAERDAFVTIFATDDPDTLNPLVWGILWSVGKERYDYFGTGLASAIDGRLMGPDGTPYLAAGGNLYRLFTSVLRGVEWVSPKITAKDTLYAKFYWVRVWGEPSAVYYSEDEGAWVQATVTADGDGTWKATINSGGAGAWKRVRSLQLKVQGQIAGDAIRAVGVIYRSIGER